jgi:hypothetical protein
VTAERWLPIPDSYSELSNLGNVQTVHHVVIRSSGLKYTVRPPASTMDKRQTRP